MLQDPSINILTEDVGRLVAFYTALGLRETFRTPKDGTPTHVEVTLEKFTIGISSVKAAIEDHGINPQMGGRPIAIIFWTDDADAEYDRVTKLGARPLRAPEDFRNLRTAWVTDPDGNPVTLAQRRS